MTPRSMTFSCCTGEQLRRCSFQCREHLLYRRNKERTRRIAGCAVLFCIHECEVGNCFFMTRADLRPAVKTSYLHRIGRRRLSCHS